MRIESVIFDGITFTRDLDAKQATNRKYFRASGVRYAGRVTLHQEVYKKYYGPIPKGYEVHHKDENASNNEPENLEILRVSEHRSLHCKLHPRSPSLKTRQNLAIEGAKYGRSAKGRATASKWLKNAWRERKFRDVSCIHCGKVFESNSFHPVKFCSGVCSSASRRKSGVDSISRTCSVCGSEFTGSKHTTTHTCSKACRYKSLWKTRRSRLQAAE